MRLRLKDGSHYQTKMLSCALVERAEGEPLVAVVSGEAVDSYGDIIHQGPTEKGRGWLLDRFNASPRTYWMHDPMLPNLVMPTSTAWVEKSALLYRVSFDMGDPFAAELDRKFRIGVLSEWSVGFRDINSTPREGAGPMGGRDFWEQELREVSAVNRGAYPDTVTVGKALGIEPGEIEDDGDQRLVALRAEFLDIREELEARLRAVESALMRGAREAEERVRAHDAEVVRRIAGAADSALARIEQLQK
jgi:hypothetical protein